MSIWSLLYIFLNIVCVGSLVYLIVLLTPKRDVPASKAFIFLAGILIAWSITLTNQVTVSFSENQVLFLNRLNESIFLFIPLALVFLVDKYASVTRIMQRWVFFLLGISVLVVLATVWTNPFHQLFWRSETVTTIDNRLQILAVKTLSAKVIMVIQHLLIAFSAFHFLNLTILLNRAYHRISTTINISLALTTIFSGISLLNPDATPYNLLPVALTALTVSLAHLIIDHNIFDLTHVSRITYFDQLGDGAIITSITGTILDINTLIEKRIGHDQSNKMIGTDILERFPQWKEPFNRTLSTHKDQSTTINFTHNGEETQFDITMHPQKDMYGFFSTILIKFADVSFYRQLLDQVNELAIRDPLTGILNRRHFELLVNDHLKLAQRYQRKGCLVMLDLDDFKHINDFYGHQLGDKVLTEFCTQMDSQMRKSDIFARYGGDEFVLYLPETDPEGALKAMENFKTFILGTTFEIDGEVITLKCSAGIVPIHRNSLISTYEELIQLADKAMYAAKADSPNAVGIVVEDGITFHYFKFDKPQHK